MKLLNGKGSMYCKDCGTIFNLFSALNLFSNLYVDHVIEALNDGNWHTLNELTTHPTLRDLTITKLLQIVNFLAEYDFVLIEQQVEDDVQVTEVKLSPPLGAFFYEIGQLEKLEKKL